MFGLGAPASPPPRRSSPAAPRSSPATIAPPACRRRAEAGLKTADLKDSELGDIRGAGAGARRAADPSRAALVRAAAQARRRRGHRRHRAVLRERARAGFDVPFIAITGTNGKSTTTALTRTSCAQPAATCRSAATSAPPCCRSSDFAPGRLYVIECSSYQIDLAPSLDATRRHPAQRHARSPRPPRHHRELRGREGAAWSQGAEHAVVGVDDDWCRDIAEGLRKHARVPIAVSAHLGAARLPIATSASRHEASCCAGAVRHGDRRSRRHRRLARRAQRRERLRHRRGDALAAASRCAPTNRRGADDASRALPHRLEELGRQGRTLFVNDSKATNADCAEKALVVVPRRHLLDPRRQAESGRHHEPRRALCARQQSLPDRRGDGGVRRDARRQGRLRALRHAGGGDGRGRPRCRCGRWRASRSCCCRPACASFDQFRNFEVRGEAFRALVAALPGMRA